MNKLKYLTAVLIAVAGMGLQQAQADLLTGDAFFTNGPIGNPSADLAYLQSHGGPDYQPFFLPQSSVYLGKENAGGNVENGAINLTQYITITETNSQTWHISWNLTGSGFTLDGILVKNGNTDPSKTLYKFYGVSNDQKLIGSGDVTLADFNKNISFVEFFGSPGGAVPDGGTTVMLLGAALGALGMARRYLRS